MLFSVVPSTRHPPRGWRLPCSPVENNTSREDPDALGSDAPVRLIRWGGTFPSRRRFVQGLSFASFAALGGNFGGVTSALLSLDGGRVAAGTKLDVLVPVKSYMRCWNPDLGFEFVYPAKWLADQTLIRRAAARIEQENPIDLPSLRASRRSYSNDPVAAYGPPGGGGEENVSVIVTDSADGFRLQSLGTAEEAAGKLLATRIAPEGSDIVGDLVRTNER